ncbi:cysteine hydrolase family protein [Marinivivus vitaminiproducens]|uniref:cysteine hydrolase family protein n=1 Tax=Marinivivus vitaminiproducens TaxID=3035935 RepID=UPI00279C6F13|nr:cysteine hydrolase family protein [Geminicoccaceae bacterium SCSIO 64248]
MTTALIVIDLQRGMFDPAQPAHDGEAVLARVAALLARARAAGVPVLHVRHDGGAGDPLQRDTPGWTIHPAVAPMGVEPVIDKDRSSAFHGTGLHERLQAGGIGRLVIAGMQTEFCIDTTCRAAHDLGYAVALVADGHTTFDTPDLSAAQVVAHHNRTLRNGGFAELADAAAVVL